MIYDIWRTFVRQMTKDMKSKKKSVHPPFTTPTGKEELNLHASAGNMGESPDFRSKNVVLTKDFTYQDFKKIADDAPFTLRDWAGFLHTSERTLHRYAKENSSFNGLQIERILLFKKLITQGNRLFGKENFPVWLDRKIFSLLYHSPRELLLTHDGVQEVIDIMGRIEHGIVA